MSLQGLKLLLAPPAWWFLKTTVRIPLYSPPASRAATPLIFACLHRDILPAIMYVRCARPALLVSNSPDGEILVRTLGEADYRFVRGATGLDGGRALVRLRRELSAGNCVGVAVDGPEGPFGRVREGVLHLARMTGAPILPLVARADRPLVLDTWDRTVVPLPFRRVRMEEGPLMDVGEDSGDEALRAHRGELADFFGVSGETA